jgi:hypothetical protein
MRPRAAKVRANLQRDLNTRRYSELVVTAVAAREVWRFYAERGGTARSPPSPARGPPLLIYPSLGAGGRPVGLGCALQAIQRARVRASCAPVVTREERSRAVPKRQSERRARSGKRLL